MKKASKYNVYLHHKESFFVYNQLSSDLREVDKELFEVLKHNQVAQTTLDDEVLYDLKKNLLICDEGCVEENMILCANKQYRFSDHSARVTIMPTLECNFRGWYCYESHSDGHMALHVVGSHHARACASRKKSKEA